MQRTAESRKQEKIRLGSLPQDRQDSRSPVLELQHDAGLRPGQPPDSPLRPEVPQKVLIAVVSCRQFRKRAQAQRDTWVGGVDPEKADVVFFVGKGKGALKSDEVRLDVEDYYEALPHKVQAVCRWALDRGYTHVFKIDDDVYVQPDRLLRSGFEKTDYTGRLRGASGPHPSPYCSGFAYWMSRRAMEVIVDAPVNDQAEDRFVGNSLAAAGILAVPDYRYAVITSTRNARSGKESPLVTNDVIAVAELDPARMAKVHEDWVDQVPGRPRQVEGEPAKFSDICVLVKTFLRDGMLFKAVSSIETNLPGVKIIVVDDGRESKKKIEFYSTMRERGHVCVHMEFDSGFCAKSNRGVLELDRPYLLIASDDFDFTGAGKGVEKMRTVLEKFPEIGVASGRVDNIQYEGYLNRHGDVITETRLNYKDLEEVDGVEFARCDITVNYNLVRREVFFAQRYLDGPGLEEARTDVVWDERYKIGGDHFEFYDQVARAGWQVAWVKGAVVHQFKYDSALQDQDYAKYRQRAKDSLPLFFEKYQLKKYVAFDGRADVLLPDGKVINVPPSAPVRSSDFALRRGPVGHYTATDRLYITDNNEVVGKDHRGRKYLLAARGQKIPMKRAVELGLVED